MVSALWKSLLRIYKPSTRSRSLALMQAIHSYPNFSPGVSSIAQISKLEELVKDYERCSGQSYPREILVSTLLRCIPSPLKEHIHLQLTDRTTYAQVKESVLVYERRYVCLLTCVLVLCFCMLATLHCTCSMQARSCLCLSGRRTKF